MPQGSKYKVTFEISGEVDGYVPKRGKTVIELKNTEDRIKQIKELLSDVFDIKTDRIILRRIEDIK